MDARIAELHNKVFSTPRNSPEREQAYSELSESDRTAVFNLEIGRASCRERVLPPV